jgi:hypothetical protein
MRRQAQLRVILEGSDAGSEITTGPVTLLLPVELNGSTPCDRSCSPPSALTAALNLMTSKALWQAIHAVALLAAGLV